MNADGPQTFANVMDMSIGLILKFLVVVSLVPLFSLPAIVSVHRAELGVTGH